MGLMANVDAIVAGAGIWGCTVARRLAESGRKVLVLEKRTAVDGYNALFERMLDHPNIEVRCNHAFSIEQSNNLNNRTIIMREYPKAWAQGDEPYYPVNNEESSQILAKYREESDKYKNLTIGGRLGEFKYYDMDQSIAQALNLKII